VLSPNTRMQRTRSSPSALRSPLMRCSLGRREPRQQLGGSSLVQLEFPLGKMISES